VDQANLYKQFHLDEPWDSPHNKTLIAKMPPIFRAPASRLKMQEGRTNYVLPVGPGTAFVGRKPLTFPKDIPDGTSNTIMILEVNDDRAVLWTKPDDLAFDPKQPLKGLGGLDKEGFNVAMFDGSARFVSGKVSPETLRRAINPADGEVLGPDW
jgi:prepilin-type processing-associated H-X9-DG protein